MGKHRGGRRKALRRFLAIFKEILYTQDSAAVKYAKIDELSPILSDPLNKSAITAIKEEIQGHSFGNIVISNIRSLPRITSDKYYRGVFNRSTYKGTTRFHWKTTNQHTNKDRYISTPDFEDLVILDQYWDSIPVITID